MSASVFRRNTCRLCNSRDLKLVLQLAPSPIGDDYVSRERCQEIQELFPRDLFLCQNCGYVHLADTIDPEVLYKNYIYTTSSSLGLDEHFGKYASSVLHRLNLPKESLVLDIGCNDGILLKHFQKQGMKVLGVEPASHIAQKVAESGIDVLSTFFSTDLAVQIEQDRGKVALITANNVFANIDDLNDMIEGIGRLLASDGVFVFETGYLVDVLQNEIFENIYHEHLSYFSVKPLQAFFLRHNLELIDVERVPTKGGSLRGFVQPLGGTRKVSPSVRELITLEDNLGCDRSETYTAFAARIDESKKQLVKLLSELKAKGKSIAGYGASITCTSLIYDFELDNFLSFVVDDNPVRHGLFTPGHHIPVLPSEVIYEQKPDYILIVAWRYAEPIMKKHQEYLNQGGKFILPLPELEIESID
jgi:SAM-dependent methyltransferase